MKIDSDVGTKIVRIGKWNNNYYFTEHLGMKVYSTLNELEDLKGCKLYEDLINNTDNPKKGDLCIEVLRENGTKYWKSHLGSPRRHYGEKESRYVEDIEEVDSLDHDIFLREQGLLREFSDMCCERISRKFKEEKTLSIAQILDKYSTSHISTALTKDEFVRFLEEFGPTKVV